MVPRESSSQKLCKICFTHFFIGPNPSRAFTKRPKDSSKRAFFHPLRRKTRENVSGVFQCRRDERAIKCEPRKMRSGLGTPRLEGIDPDTPSRADDSPSIRFRRLLLARAGVLGYRGWGEKPAGLIKLTAPPTRDECAIPGSRTLAKNCFVQKPILVILSAYKGAPLVFPISPPKKIYPLHTIQARCVCIR